MKKQSILQEKPKILVIVGPTAVGKSALAVQLARRFGGEIISADSRQVYKGLDGGTGKITKKEMRGVPHHLLDVASPKRQFSVSLFVKKARRAIQDSTRRGRLPIIVGGTGLYIDALLGKVSIPEVPPNLKLRKRLEKKTAPELFVMLKELDAERARTIDRHNPRRLIRAIEIARFNAKRNAISKCLVERSDPRTFANCVSRSAKIIGLVLPPEELKKAITIRLFSRISRGMVGEVQRLHNKGLSWKRMEELGLEYRYLSRHLRGLITKKELTHKLTSEIWKYAKRQMRWFKRNQEIRWFQPSQNREIYAMLKRTGL